MTLAGARDPDLRPVARSLRGLTGQTSSQWLAARRPGAYDRLDGFVASLISQGLREPEAATTPPTDPAARDVHWAAAMDRVFPATTL
jgi:hypothetical protein